MTFSDRKKRGKINIFFFSGICCISLKQGTHRDIHPNIAQSGKHWDGWPRLGVGLEDMQEKPSAYKVRNPYSHTRTECVFFWLLVNCNWIGSTLIALIGKEKGEKRHFFYYYYSTQTTCSLWLEREREKKTVINLRVQEWKVGSGMRCSCQTALESVALYECRWFFFFFFFGGAGRSVEMRHQSRFGLTRSETLHLTYKFWP